MARQYKSYDEILKLRIITVKKYNHAGKSTTDNTKDYSNLLNQDFKAEKPSKTQVGNGLEI